MLLFLTCSAGVSVAADEIDFGTVTEQHQMIPMRDGKPMTEGSIEEQTRNCMEQIKATLALTGCDMSNIVKTTVWLKDRSDFPGFDTTYGEYFDAEPPARTGLLNDFLVDMKVEIECMGIVARKRD